MENLEDDGARHGTAGSERKVLGSDITRTRRLVF
jgi:hypothetical protein